MLKKLKNIRCILCEFFSLFRNQQSEYLGTL